MQRLREKNIAVQVDKAGVGEYTRHSFAKPRGIYSEIKTPQFEFQFNLRGQIKSIRGLNSNWPHPFEMLKRTDGNDWIFCTVGKDSTDQGIISWYGEYYHPCLPYRSNSILKFDPFTDPQIMSALAAWYQLYADLAGITTEGLPESVKSFIDLVRGNDDNRLYEQSQKLNAIIGQRISVLPPDTRYVDYEVIPLIISDGCLYQCKFCCVKANQFFTPRTMEDIRRQIEQLKSFYSRDLKNYNALFLGNHDALCVQHELLLAAASEAIGSFELEAAAIKNPMLFLFGSVGSLLNAKNLLFERLNELPVHTYINIGFESVDAATLADIKKPVDTAQVRDAFEKMLEINRSYQKIELTGNFLIGDQMTMDHYTSMGELLSGISDADCRKGSIYLSPLINNRTKGTLLKTFSDIKKHSRLPLYMYLIQRL
jgi:hypothetical protein